MGMQKKINQARKTRWTLATGRYQSGRFAGFGVQNARVRLGLTKATAEQLAKIKEASK